MILRRTALSLFSFAIAASISLPALAEEAMPEKKAGVPQFDPSSFAGQLFWLVISFFILYVLMAKLVLPRIGRVVEGRAHAIAQDLQKAQADRDATQLAIAGYEMQVIAARNEAQSLISQAQQQASQTQTIALSAQGNKIAGDIHAAEERIATAKQQALASIAPAASSAASAMIQKVAGITPDESKLKAAVDAALQSKAA